MRLWVAVIYVERYQQFEKELNDDFPSLGYVMSVMLVKAEDT
jgi:hypothetical protein